MTVLAAIEAKAIFVIVALIVGAIGQWNEARRKKQAEENPPNTPPTRPPSPPNNASESEQERLRRFLETLGVPASAPRPIAAPAPTAKQIVPLPVRPQMRNVPRAKQPKPGKPARPQEESTTTIEPIAAQNAAMAKGAEPSNPEPPPAATAAALTLDRPQNTLNVALRAMLNSPQNLRAAFLAREILGPPKSLAE